MDTAAQLKRGISRQLSTGSFKKSGKFSFQRQISMDPKRNNFRFSFGRQSSMDPIRRGPLAEDDGLTVPENLDSTMQLLSMACKGDVKGVQDLLDEGIDVNSIDLDGRTALHIAACEGHVEVVKLLLSRRANIDAHDRWGSTAAADAKYYGNVEVYNILKARGAKVPKTRKTPMVVANPREVPEYELSPLDIQIRKSDGISKGSYQVAKWNGTKVSVKILDKESYSDPESINAFQHELTLLEKVRHPNVVQFIGAVTQKMPMMIVLEYHSKGDLGSYLQKKGRLSPSKALRFALEIARGMNYLHECKPDPVIHCDLKPKNILLDCGGQLKVAGFGVLRLSKVSEDKFKLERPEAIDRTSLYVATEIFKDEIFDRSVDVYSFGLLLYEMVEGVPPFSKSPEEIAKLMTLDDKRLALKMKSKSFPPDLKKLIEECCHPDCVGRPTFSEIIVRLEKVVVKCSKHGWWKDAFKLPWK
ncbi:integrin-linked protein kinase 1-like isoform X2 [Olea europaea var. sylvestris]|uniref:integrin-linked protein kinase 1-like isoform X1 n=1 Tax=Olea europaea var. sylvestris TaxID=158386 RepID=UPI000C1CCEDC|nr:integrin-linked protein kinase 1-like isoform X1 [Olea europaea var. sylvestris]XP_022887752.1 integrin-linked protein kinase 1-like isoform X2 [Olea europaea var. sylvestris]XP_022887754.1 integrin-linked protein kinase 1-like isoform X1 [Olea europaea var. sylvestris]XP_022887755.1 integrin-linked protein kinase 1-like isoform X2 [Olea europaea var. sylvestris]